MKNVQVLTKDNGTVIESNPGDTILLSLDSSPVTGYAWKLDYNDPTIVEQIQTGFNKTGNNAIGGAVQQYFSFRCLKRGESKISLRYYRHWEGDSSTIKNFEIIVRVT